MAIKNKIQFILEVLEKAVKGEVSQEELQQALDRLKSIESFIK